MSSCIYLSLILATLLTQVSSVYYEDCHIANNSVEIVTACPTSKEEWDDAARKKNCKKLSAQEKCKENKLQYIYHCVINEYVNETLEVCAPKRIIFGYCTEFNNVGGVIQRHRPAKCNDIFPKCDPFYNSSEAYKYPDCYELVYMKRESKTTSVSPEARTTPSKPNHGKNPIRDSIIGATVIFCGVIICVVRTILCKRHKRNIPDDDERHGLIKDAVSKPLIKYLNIKAKHLQHFKYVCNLAKDCTRRIGNLITDENWINCMFDRDTMIKVGIIGKLTADNISLFLKGKEENMIDEMDKLPLGATPHFCFQNDLPSNAALEILKKENACPKIVIQSELYCNKTNKADDLESVIIVCQDKQQIKKTIKICLEKQLDQILQDLLGKLKQKGLNKQTSDIIDEIEAIRKQLVLETSKNTASPDVSCNDNNSIVPIDVKDFLLRRCDVNSFGIWGRSTFKIFVKKETDEKILKRELIKLDKNFFKKYRLKTESGNIVEKHTMRLHDSVQFGRNITNNIYKILRLEEET